MQHAWTHDQKADFCRQFLASGEPQESFCERHREEGGPSARSLREWLRTYTDPDTFRSEARAIVAHAVGELDGLLRAFDALDGVRRHAEHVATTGHARAASVNVPAEPEAARRQDGSDSEPAATYRGAAGRAKGHAPDAPSGAGRQLSGACSEAEQRQAGRDTVPAGPGDDNVSAPVAEAHADKRQAAGGMSEPVVVPAEVLVVPAAIVERDEQVPAVAPALPATPRRRRKSFFDDFSLPAPEAGEEHALDDLDTVRQATARSS